MFSTFYNRTRHTCSCTNTVNIRLKNIHVEQNTLSGADGLTGLGTWQWKKVGNDDFIYNEVIFCLVHLLADRLVFIKVLTGNSSSGDCGAGNSSCGLAECLPWGSQIPPTSGTLYSQRRPRGSDQVKYSTVQYSTVQYSTVQYSTEQNSAVQ